MNTSHEACLLRIYISESDHFEGRPLYEAIVLKARAMNLAGATVLRGPLGYGVSHVLHTGKILRLSDNLPVVVEIVESREKIEAFWTVAQTMVASGLVTLEAVAILHPEAKPEPE